MSSRSKIEEVQFYLDRSLDALTTLLRSIIENPRIENTERLQALRMLADHHSSIAGFISSRIAAGERQGIEQKVVEQAYSGRPE